MTSSYCCASARIFIFMMGAFCSIAIGANAPAKTTHEVIVSQDAPAAIGPYSQAVLAGGVLYVSGQVGLDPKTGKLAAEDIRGQTKQVIINLTAVLSKAGLTLDDTVQVQVFLADLNDYAAMNEVYAQYFKLPPARATVQVARLPRDALIEIALIAVR
jgi:2-iminobutanoate/2-iminopropanoate deaminase